MPVEIRVGPPTITISQGRTFMVTTQAGEIISNTDQGVYAIDTRFLSFYRLYINQVPLQVINSSQLTFYAARYHLTNPHIETEDGVIDEQTLRVTINRVVHEGIHEDIDIANYTGKSIHFLLELSMRSDFADLFEVKSKHIVQRGQEQTQWDAQNRQLYTTYDNKDFHRAIRYCILNEVAVGYANGRLRIEIALAPNQHWHTCCEIRLEHGQHVKKPAPESCSQPSEDMNATKALLTSGREQSNDFEQRQERWQAHCTGITTSNHHIYRVYQQAVEDMGALRIYDMDVSDEA
ncbi:glycogen debranching N-terminal domain-containing protein [Dictyobacter kobayashii]|uniref:Putative glycogen debranching enzyme N-terminal domain-containing protein n=1 Tax=Dictyobacter kobayashii TaxID=2014872 RepID=A0A402ADE9_9CHLR|nr:glycogen debranching N-terminal domain-containing protein [Dictyobacter kobayashii]GCE17137.1 hypothetical protein KDK_09370 [Dictyobacter kobayashii]